MQQRNWGLCFLSVQHLEGQRRDRTSGFLSCMSALRLCGKESKRYWWTSSLGCLQHSQRVIRNRQGKVNVKIYNFVMWSSLRLLLSPVSSNIHFLIIMVKLQCNINEVLHINSYALVRIKFEYSSQKLTFAYLTRANELHWVTMKIDWVS